MHNLIYDACSIAYQLTDYLSEMFPTFMDNIAYDRYYMITMYIIAAILFIIPYLTAFACLYACVRGVLGVFTRG